MKTRALMLTPKQVAERHSVDVDNVLAWIRSGELPAINVGKRNGRPRYRVDVVDLAAFEIDAKCGRKLLRAQPSTPEPAT